MYRGRLARDLDHWVARGLLPQPLAAELLAEFDSRPQSFTVGRVLMMLAAVLVASALLLFIAANWDGMDRAIRSGLLIASIWIFHGAAAYTSARGSHYWPGVFLVLALAAFGGSIALIGQMYNLSGDELSATMVWFAMCVASAALFRSAALTYFAGLLGFTFFIALLGQGSITPRGIWFYMPPLQAIVVVLLAYYTGGMRARHLSYLLGLSWVGWIVLDHRLPVQSWHVGVAGELLFLAVSLRASPLSALARRAGPAPAFYSFLLGLCGLILYQVDASDLFGNGTDRLVEAVPAILAGAFAVLAIALEGRDNGAIRYLGYAVFAGEILYLSMEVAGTMIDTSGLFLLSGFFLGGVAWLVIRMERRFGSRHEEGRA